MKIKPGDAVKNETVSFCFYMEDFDYFRSGLTDPRDFILPMNSILTIVSIRKANKKNEERRDFAFAITPRGLYLLDIFNLVCI